MRVQITLPDEDGAALKKLADEEDRTVAGQARHLLRKCLAVQRMIQEDRLQPPHKQGWPPDALQDPQSETAHDVHSGLTPDSSPDAKGMTTGAQHPLPG